MSKSVTTTPSLVGNTDVPQMATIHADSGNTDYVKVSWTTSNVEEYDELNKGETLYLYGFVGQIHAAAVSGTQKVSVQMSGGVVVRAAVS